MRISLSPAEINIESDSNKEVCKNITLITSDNATLIPETRWSAERDFIKDFSKLNLTASSLGIKINYSQNVFISQKIIFKICFKSEKPGVYHGALIFSAERGLAAVGCWINLNVSAIKNENKITGYLINEKTDTVVPLLISTFFLIIALVFVIYLSKTSKH